MPILKELHALTQLSPGIARGLIDSIDRAKMECEAKRLAKEFSKFSDEQVEQFVKLFTDELAKQRKSEVNL